LVQHQVFEEKIKAVLAKAGLPIAATYDASLSCGVYLEVIDDEKLPPEVFLKWRVYSTLYAHFRGVSPGQLESDPQVAEMANMERAMNAAITAILTFSGFEVMDSQGERAGELIIGEREAS
jgi:hypothetical protein